MRLDRLRALEDCRLLLAPSDRQGLLTGAAQSDDWSETIDDDKLLAELEDGAERVQTSRRLRHVSSNAERRVAEEIANRVKCENFEQFKPLFEKVQREIEQGVRQTRDFEVKAEIEAGRMVHTRRPKDLCGRNGRDVHECPGADRRATARDFRQRDREQYAHALASARAKRRRDRAADHGPCGGTFVQRPLPPRSIKAEWHDLPCANVSP